MSGEELAAALAAEQGGFLFVSHDREYPIGQPFLPEGTFSPAIPLVIRGTATRDEYVAQIQRARELSGLNISVLRHRYFYRCEAAD